MKQVVLLSTKGDNCDIVANFLASKNVLSLRINEEPISRKLLFKRRLKKLGFFKVFGQVLFIIFVGPILRLMSAKRLNEIQSDSELINSQNTQYNIVNVTNINNSEVYSLVQKQKPDLVLVFGTRIIKESIFSKFGCPVYNMHVGITPAYRGVHGGYWSLVNDDSENFGVTIHQIDAGIDTGQVEYQATTEVKPTDNFSTYPLLQVVIGLSLIEDLITGAQSAHLTKSNTTSKLYYHPTLLEYFTKRLTKGVK